MAFRQEERQRSREWCEPGRSNRLKILPEPQSEHQHRVVIKNAGPANRYNWHDYKFWVIIPKS